jgi:hypothetical protein
VLAVWSSGPNVAFTKRLRAAEFEVSEVGVRATTKRSGAHHVIWFATKPKAPAKASRITNSKSTRSRVTKARF